MKRYLIGIDGGGTGTRARITELDGQLVGQGEAGPSALGQGIDQAWRNVARAIANAFANGHTCVADVDECALGLGMSGVHNPLWRNTFLALNPGYHLLALQTDARTALLGAHGGRPGMVLIAGTGSVGEVLRADGSFFTVGGWGFPNGDEGSGSLLGRRAVQHAQYALDGRRRLGPLAASVLARIAPDRNALHAWCASAGQFDYASLAPLVFDAEDQDDAARAILDDAVYALQAHVLAMDPMARLPLAVMGSVALRLKERFSASIRTRCVIPEGDALDGALRSASLLPQAQPA